MKFFKKLLIAVSVVILTITLVACSTKTPLTVEGFTDIMESEGFSVSDATVFSQTVVIADTVMVAMNDYYSIEFYDIDCNKTAYEFFELNKDAFENEDAVPTSTTEQNSSNFDYYDMTSDTGFHLVSRIDNTVVYCYTDEEYKDDVLKLVDTLGYR